MFGALGFLGQDIKRDKQMTENGCLDGRLAMEDEMAQREAEMQEAASRREGHRPL